MKIFEEDIETMLIPNIANKRRTDMKLKQIGSNMTELYLNNGTIVLFSYETPVAYYKPQHDGIFTPGIDLAKTKQWYSNTTSKHINKWIQSLIPYHWKQSDVCEVDQSVLDELVK